MTEPAASRFEIGDEPHFPLHVLRSMRAEVDALLGFLLSERTEDEVRTGLELLRLADSLTDVESHDALRFAIDLLSEGQVDEVARLLEMGDEYTAREAATRLRAMKSPRAADALRRYAAETARFVADCVAALRAARLNVTDVRENTPRLSRVGGDILRTCESAPAARPPRRRERERAAGGG